MAEADYLEAEEKYRTLLEEQEQKRESEKFLSVRNYLREKYLDLATDKLDESKVHGMIEAKSKRYKLATETKKGNDYTNWCQAAEYVEKFYNNIISAVMHSDEQAKAQLRGAILLSEGKESRFSIMNAFEAAICLYFAKSLKFEPDDWKR
jgi:hypothetical protein